ncbi:S-adenosylmethionine mitochondrial carrier protein [Martensiomyces pterosporus]|nr:S-adenosylmethionine mitochondrial carrier protein [Martensiomyces pterosporus]
MPREVGTPNTSQCLAAGGFAGMAVDTVLFPLDTIKTRLQAKAGFMASGGFRGIYSGLSSAVIGSSPGAAMFFLTYEQVKAFSEPRVSAEYQPFVHMLAASAGEVAACMVRVPTEVIKQRLQAKHHSSLGAAIRGTYRSEGVLGFYRGYLTQVVREIPFTCIQFPIYEYLKHWYAQKQGRKIKSWEAAVCGSFAGGTAAAVTTPLDVVKTRVMLSTKGMGAHVEYSGIASTLTRIAREEGARALFSGIVPRTIWISVGGFIFLGSYEKVKSTLLDAGVLA